VAQWFTAGGVSQTLGSVTLRLENTSFGDETVTVHLYSNVNTFGFDQPGSSLLTIGSFTIPAQTNSFADFMLSAPAFTLQANTTYWLEAEGSSSLGPLPVSWAETLSTTTTGPGTLGSWARTPGPPVWTPAPSGRLQLEVDSAEVAGVPEPSGLALAGLGALALLGFGRRLRRAG
jgi:hypothetical protein